MVNLLLVIFLTIVFIYILLPQDKGNGATTKLVVKQKTCPPHQWYWQEIVDEHGVKQSERIVCKVCGPLSKLMDGSVE